MTTVALHAFAGAARHGPGWTATASLRVPQSGATITVLPNGKVLVVGGFNNTSAALTDAELYDPQAGTWMSTGSLHMARYDHSAILLHTGKVLVAGGFGPSTTLASAELYDPYHGTWAMTGRMHYARGDYSATLLTDGEVLVAGGVSPDAAGPASAELYNPRTGRWRMTGRMTVGRSTHQAVLLHTGKVLVVGGDNGDSAHALASAELYDPQTAIWRRTGSMIYPRDNFTATLLHNGTVLVSGFPPLMSLISCPGSVCPAPTHAEIYTPQTGTWTRTGNMRAWRNGHTATLLPDGTVLVAGGSGSTCGSANCPPLASAEIYFPWTNVWTMTGSMRHGRYDAEAALLPNGATLVVGGLAAGDRASLVSAEIYGPDRKG